MPNKGYKSPFLQQHPLHNDYLYSRRASHIVNQLIRRCRQHTPFRMMFPHNFVFFAAWFAPVFSFLTAWKEHAIIAVNCMSTTPTDMHVMATWFPPSVVTNVQCSQSKLSKFSSSERHHFLCQGSIECIWLSCQANCFQSLWSSSLLKANTSAEWFDPSGQLTPQTFLEL